MQNQIAEQWTSVAMNSYEKIKDIDVVNTKALRQLADLQLDFLGTNIESSADYAKALIDKDTFENFISENIKFSHSFNEQYADFTRRAIGLIAKARDEIVGAVNLTEDEDEDVTLTPPPAKPVTPKPTKPKRVNKKAATNNN